MTKLVIPFTILFLLGLSFTLNAQEQDELLPQVNQLLNNYQKYSQMTEDEIEISETYKQNYIDLFETPNSPVYNDIKSLNETDESVTALTYAEQLESWYDIGVTSELSLPVSAEQISESYTDTVAGRRYVFVHVERRVYGFYKDVKIHRMVDSLYFKISYSATDDNYSGFKIKEILKKYDIPEEPPREKKMFYAGLRFSPGFSFIDNENIYYDDYLNNNRQFGFIVGLDLSYYFTDAIGIGTGIEFSRYRSRLNLSEYENTFDTLDIDSEQYVHYTYGKNIDEEQTIGFVDIPLLLKLKFGQPQSAKFYLNTGVKIGFPIVKSYTADGRFTYEGYYSAYNVRLYNLDSYGFVTDADVEGEEDLPVDSPNISAVVSMGVLLPLNDSFFMSFGATYVQGLSNISGFQNPDFQLSRSVTHYESMMHSADKAKTQFIGIEAALLYRFGL